MHEQIKRESFRQLLGNSVLVSFARRVITESYVECAPAYKQVMRDLLRQAFAMLVDSRNDDLLFRVTVNYLVREVFRKNDPEFWFNRVYKHYKRQLKPVRRLKNLQPWLKGERILDLGCGDGLTGAVLRSQGFRVCLADVLDYRDELAKSLPYVKMVDPRKLSFADRDFDTAIVLAVLHHVQTTDLYPLLSELRRVSRRVIVEEDCYVVPLELEGLGDVWLEDEYLRDFMDLLFADQLRFLMFMDYFANAITQGLSEMSVPFNFHTVREWQTLFVSQGFQVRKTLLLGFQKGFFNRSCHVWFILDGEAA
jgi:SAM-dependent methyltransferase